MSVILDEQRLNLVEAGRLEGVNPATIWRWLDVGILAKGGERIRLESFKRGGRVHTTREALSRFYAALSRDPGSVSLSDKHDLADEIAEGMGI